MSPDPTPIQSSAAGAFAHSRRHTETGAGGGNHTDDGALTEGWRSELAELLGEGPPEALLDGPPDADLVLRRTLRQMRSETAAHRRRRRLPRLVAAAAAVVALLAGGVAIGRATAPEPVVVTAAGPQAGAVVLQGEGVPGVSMTAVVAPAAGWVRVSTNVRGIQAGERCEVVVLTRSGRGEVAASWLTSAR